MFKLKKRLILFCFVFFSFVSSMADDVVYGDVNGSGTTDIEDVTALISYILTGEETHSPSGGNPVVNPGEGDLMSFNVNGVKFNMVKVEGGTFTMGATADQGWDNIGSNETPTHQVTLSTYYIGETEVTQLLWLAVMGTRPSTFNGENLPVYEISWNKCQEFVEKLSELTGYNFRLPTEAEWEFAARGGNKTNYHMFSGGNLDAIDQIAYYGDKNSPIDVASLLPNELGIYDMSGNVYEWCYDIYGNYSSAAQVNPTGPASGNKHVIRGGCAYSTSPTNCRVAYRHDLSASSTAWYIEYTSYLGHRHQVGMRLALTIDE